MGTCTNRPCQRPSVPELRECWWPEFSCHNSRNRFDRKEGHDVATDSIEERLAALEADVARLKQERFSPEETDVPWWERRFGAFKDDPAYDEAMRLGEVYRQSQPTPADDV